MAYAYLCAACKHLSTNHRLVKGGEVRQGPYRCWAEDCACEIAQDAPTYPLSKFEFLARFPGHAAATRP